MKKDLLGRPFDILKRQSANALLTVTLDFLRQNKIPRELILDTVRSIYGVQRSRSSLRQYRRLVRAYEEMGIVMSTWFSHPRFLDGECRPIPLTAGRGSRSLSALLRSSRVNISASAATTLMRQSSSVRTDDLGNFVALSDMFVLPDFEIARAALVIERYLDTLRRNSSSRKRKTVLLLERNCHVPEVNLKTIAPVLRDIKGRGAAFINSVDGDIESRRVRRPMCKEAGEMSVHIFAWTRPTRPKKSKSVSRICG